MLNISILNERNKKICISFLSVYEMQSFVQMLDTQIFTCADGQFSLPHVTKTTLNWCSRQGVPVFYANRLRFNMVVGFCFLISVTFVLRNYFTDTLRCTVDWKNVKIIWIGLIGLTSTC